MLLERKSRRAQAAPVIGRPWVVLGVGAALHLLAVHGRWDLAPAAWLSGVFLLRTARTTGVVKGSLLILAVTTLGVVYLLFQGGLPVLGPLLLLCVPLGAVFVLPYLLDRLVNRHLASPLLRTLVFPTAVAGAEYLIATATPIGTALGSLAATQHENLPLLQLASVTGGYGVSFLVAWLAPVANEAWERRLSWPRIRTVVLTFLGVLAVVLLGGTARLAFSAPTAETVRVAGVSWSREAHERSDAMLERFDSIRDAVGQDPGAVRAALAVRNDDLLASTERELVAGAEVVVWPEAGAAVLDADRVALLDRVGALAAEHRAYIEVGMVSFTGRPGLAGTTNEALLVDPQGRVLWDYHKAHPVPFMDMIEPGPGEVPTADTPYGRIATVICFDADFPALMRQARDVDLMLVPSNDWQEYGQTHTEKATLRAVENGYSLVRQDSRGLSRVVDPQGRTLAQADFFTTDQQTVVAEVPVEGTRTIYGAVGDVFAWSSIAALLLLVAAAARPVVIRRSAGRSGG
jgi:apolipoprotein N-acyltransferase